MPTTTTVRYWCVGDAGSPDAIGIETTTEESNDGGDPYRMIGGGMPDDATEITQAEYDAALAARNAAAVDRSAELEALGVSDAAARAAAALAAYNDLVANGVSPVTATTLTGHGA